MDAFLSALSVSGLATLGGGAVVLLLVVLLLVVLPLVLVLRGSQAALPSPRLPPAAWPGGTGGPWDVGSRAEGLLFHLALLIIAVLVHVHGLVLVVHALQ